MPGIFDTGIFDTGIFDHAEVAPVVSNTALWLGPEKASRKAPAPEPQVQQKPKKKKRVKTDEPQVVIESDVTTHTGIVTAKRVTPALDVFGEIQQRQAQAEAARLDKLRSIAAADDEWLMVA